MYKLRNYQQKCVDIGYEFLTADDYKGHSVIVAPCAAGKSLIIGGLSSMMNEPTLCLQPSVELLYQNSEKAISYGANPYIFSASAGKKEIGHLTYATLGSVITHIDTFRKMGFKHMLVDECEKGYPPEAGSMFQRFVKGVGIERILGFTASPYRLKRYGDKENNWSQLNVITRTRPRIFENLLHVIQIQEMVDRGYWCKLNYEIWKFDKSNLMVNSSGAEYTEESISRAIEVNGTNNKIIVRLAELLSQGREHILVFMDKVSNCKKAMEFMNSRGYSTAVVTGEMNKKDRAATIAAFKAGKINVVFNYSAIMQGFDYPCIDAIIFGRPTMSLNVWMQALGRGCRIDPDGNKEDCLIVDCVDNYSSFGRMEDISIENIDGYGWGVFSKEKVLTGGPVDENRYRSDLPVPIDKLPRPEEGGDLIYCWGEYEGRKFKDVPMSVIMKQARRTSIAGMTAQEAELINYFSRFKRLYEDTNKRWTTINI